MNKTKEILFFSLIFLLLICCGFIVQYSTSFNDFSIFKKQLFFFLVSFPPSLFICFFCFDFIKSKIFYIYSLSLIVLLFVIFLGKTAMGAKRWIGFFGVNVQPSEIMKIILIFALAKYFSHAKYFNLNKLSYFIVPFALIIIPFFLIFLQPNLGTSLVILGIGFGIIFAFMDNKKFLTFVFLVSILSVPFFWKIVLHDYQRKRIMTFINPEDDIRGAGYNINQSKIAIGSGGLFGRGFLKGSQGKLNFLPEQHTDFVFTVFAEEFGFILTFFLISLFLLLIIRIYKIIYYIDSLENKIILFGIGVLFSLHLFINTFMTMGLIPATGVPLPFISYGRSFFLLNLFCMNFIFVIIYKDKTHTLRK